MRKRTIVPALFVTTIAIGSLLFSYVDAKLKPAQLWKFVGTSVPVQSLGDEARCIGRNLDESVNGRDCFVSIGPESLFVWIVYDSGTIASIEIMFDPFFNSLSPPGERPTVSTWLKYGVRYWSAFCTQKPGVHYWSCGNTDVWISEVGSFPEFEYAVLPLNRSAGSPATANHHVVRMASSPADLNAQCIADPNLAGPFPSALCRDAGTWRAHDETQFLDQ